MASPAIDDAAATALLYSAPYRRIAGVHHVPVRRGVPPAARAFATDLAAIAGRLAVPDAPAPRPAPALSKSTVAPLPPTLLTTSATELRRLKHSHITHKLGACNVELCARPSIAPKSRPFCSQTDPSQRLGSPQTEAHTVGWRARETWVHGAAGVPLPTSAAAAAALAAATQTGHA